MTKIYLGADHGGVTLKEKIKGWLADWKYDFEDLGAHTIDPTDDYTLYAEKVASVVGKEKALGILLCKSGVGVDVVANKFDGVRAAIGKSPEQVTAGRNDDDMNTLVIAAEFTDEGETKAMIKAFLETPFGNKSRYKRRIAEIGKIEANN